MIIHHQDNVAAFAGAHTWYWPLNPLLFRRIAVTSAVVAAAVGLYVGGPGGIAPAGAIWIGRPGIRKLGVG